MDIDIEEKIIFYFFLFLFFYFYFFALKNAMQISGFSFLYFNIWILVIGGTLVKLSS